MGETKHTPGPWRVEGWTNEHHELLDGGFEIVATDGRYHLVVVQRAPWPARIVESNANARLIAAAPDLLEAVRAGGRYSDALRRYQDQGVRGQVIPGTDELDRLFMEWHDIGHAALDKATGEAQSADPPEAVPPQQISKITGDGS